VDLVRYNATLAPASGSQSVTVQCADNAHRTSSSLRVTCRSSGSWSGSMSAVLLAVCGLTKLLSVNVMTDTKRSQLVLD
jgi:hypothetical protein